MGELRGFTLEELGQYDGRGGKPAYIAFNGKVYDVSKSALWGGGEHFSLHKAGEDATEGLSTAPHGDEKLDVVKMVGTLTEWRGKKTGGK